MIETRKFAAALIAGGKCTRIGLKKTFLQFRGKTIFERTVSLLRERFDPVWIVGNNAEDFAAYDVPVIPDKVPDSGPLVGILTALLHSRSPYTFCCACDMPFIRGEVLDEMSAHARTGGADVLLPFCDGKLHPLFAFYSQSCIPTFETLLGRGELKMHRFLDHVTVRKIPFDSARFDGISPFFNVNTPEEFEQARKLAGEEPSPDS